MTGFCKIYLASGESVLVDAVDFHWLSQRSWYRHAAGYAMCDLFGRRGGVKVLMHRLILLAPDTATVDHVNRDILDNRRANLRLATMSQQNANKIKFKGKSAFKGVYRRCDGRKWSAQIIFNGKMNYLGSFETEIDAAMAYDSAARNHHGAFARLNFPNLGERSALSENSIQE
jgi:hypothetical protein